MQCSVSNTRSHVQHSKPFSVLILLPENAKLMGYRCKRFATIKIQILVASHIILFDSWAC